MSEDLTTDPENIHGLSRSQFLRLMGAGILALLATGGLLLCRPFTGSTSAQEGSPFEPLNNYRKLFLPLIDREVSPENVSTTVVGSIYKLDNNGNPSSSSFQLPQVNLQLVQGDRRIVYIDQDDSKPIIVQKQLDGDGWIQPSIDSRDVHPYREHEGLYTEVTLSNTTFKVLSDWAEVVQLTATGPVQVTIPKNFNGEVVPGVMGKPRRDTIVSTSKIVSGHDGQKYVVINESFQGSGVVLAIPAVHFIDVINVDPLLDAEANHHTEYHGFNDVLLAYSGEVHNSIVTRYGITGIVKINEVFNVAKALFPSTKLEHVITQEDSLGDDIYMQSSLSTGEIKINFKAFNEKYPGATVETFAAYVLHEYLHAYNRSEVRLINEDSRLKVTSDLEIVGFFSSGEPIYLNNNGNLVKTEAGDVLKEAIAQYRTVEILKKSITEDGLGYTDAQITAFEEKLLKYKKVRELIKELGISPETDIMLWFTKLLGEHNSNINRELWGEDIQVILSQFLSCSNGFPVDQARNAIISQLKKSSSGPSSAKAETELGEITEFESLYDLIVD